MNKINLLNVTNLFSLPLEFESTPTFYSPDLLALQTQFEECEIKRREICLIHEELKKAIGEKETLANDNQKLSNDISYLQQVFVNPST